MPRNRFWGKSQSLEHLKVDYPNFDQFIPQLTEREQTVIRQRLEGQSLLEVATTVGVTRERIRQIEAKACRKLGARVRRSRVTVE